MRPKYMRDPKYMSENKRLMKTYEESEGSLRNARGREFVAFLLLTTPELATLCFRRLSQLEDWSKSNWPVINLTTTATTSTVLASLANLVAIVTIIAPVFTDVTIKIVTTTNAPNVIPPSTAAACPGRHR